MLVNLDHLRLLTTASLNTVGNLISKNISHVTTPNLFIQHYNELAQYIQALNSVYDDKEDNFSDLSDKMPVHFIAEMTDHD